MSNPQRKPRADSGAMPPLRRLKQQPWPLLSELLALCTSPEWKQPEIREEIKKRTGIWLASNSSLTEFSKWAQEESERRASLEKQNDGVVAMERWFEENAPETPPEQRRAKMLEWIAMNKVATGDHKDALKFLNAWQTEDSARFKGAMDVKRFEQKEREMEFDREKFRAGLKSKVEAGLDEIAALFQRAPELLAEFTALRAKLTKGIAE